MVDRACHGRGWPPIVIQTWPNRRLESQASPTPNAVRPLRIRGSRPQQTPRAKTSRPFYDGGVKDLEGEPLVGVHVLHEEDRAHAALAQPLLHSVAAREDRPRLNRR